MLSVDNFLARLFSWLLQIDTVAEAIFVFYSCSKSKVTVLIAQDIISWEMGTWLFNATNLFI